MQTCSRFKFYFPTCYFVASGSHLIFSFSFLMWRIQVPKYFKNINTLYIKTVEIIKVSNSILGGIK